MNRRRSVLCAAHRPLVALAALAVAACGSPAAGRDRQQIVFWNLFTTGTSHATLTELVRRFNDSQDRWRVVQADIPYGQIHSKMLPAIAGRVSPDVAIFDRFRVASYAARNAFLALDDLAGHDGIRAEDFFQAPWEECLYDGRLYAVPYDTDVRVLYYNRKLFREAGLDPNRPPRTWGELRDYSMRLTKRRPDGRLDQVGFVPIWGNVGALYLYGWQKGGQFTSPDGRRLTLNDPQNVAALEWIRDFIRGYGLENLMTLQSGFGGEAQDPFITGKIAMTVWDVGAVQTIKRYGADLEWGAAPCPHPADGVPATWSGGFSMVLPRGTRHVEGAWALCRFILSEPSQRYMATSSDKLPALRAAANDPFFQASAFWRLAVDQMKYSRYRPVSPAGSAIITELQTAVDQVIHGKMSPKQALDGANHAAQKVLDQFYKQTGGTKVNWTVLGAAGGAALAVLLAFRAWRSVRRIRALSIHRRQALAGYVFAAPAILGLALFTLGPILMSAVYSLTRYEILTPASWAGLANYRELFTEDRYFLKALGNTVYFAAFSVPLNITLALGLALLLNRRVAGRPLYRTCFYLPTVMPAVAGSLLWAWLFNAEYGIINVVIGGAFELGDRWGGLFFDLRELSAAGGGGGLRLLAAALLALAAWRPLSGELWDAGSGSRRLLAAAALLATLWEPLQAATGSGATALLAAAAACAVLAWGPVARLFWEVPALLPLVVAVAAAARLAMLLGAAAAGPQAWLLVAGPAMVLLAWGPLGRRLWKRGSGPRLALRLLAVPVALAALAATLSACLYRDAPWAVAQLRSPPWLTSEYWSKPALIFMGTWGVGGGMIIFLAALQGVPRSLYEAAEIDGGGAWKQFRHITLPMISPAMFFMVVMGLIGSFQVFTQAYLMTAGGPVNSTLFYVLYLYREAFENLHMGYASAMAWVLFLVILAITGVQFLLARRWVYYEGQQA